MTEIVPAISDAVLDFTYDVLIPLWLDNLANNLSLIRSSRDILDLPKKKGEPCILVGGGPSLDYRKHLDQIQKSGWTHPVLCCDKKLSDCLRHKIVPYVVASIDGSPRISGFYSAQIVRKYAESINAMLAVVVHPKVADRVQKNGLNTYWFTPMTDNPLPLKPGDTVNKKSVAYILHALTGKSMIAGFGNVGAFLWNLAFELGCDPLILVGYDLSEQVTDKLHTVYFWPFTHMFMQMKEKYPTQQKAMDAAATMHQTEVNPDFTADKDDLPYYKKGEHVQYLVNPVWKKYRDVLAQAIASSGRHTIQATENGCLHTGAKVMVATKSGKRTKMEEKFILKCPNFEARTLKEVLSEYV